MIARSILFACTLALFAGPATAGMLSDVPDAIVCDVGAGKLVVYAARRMDDGSTLYGSLEREFSIIITIDANGVLHWDNNPDCDGKTVEQLRSDGKAFDLAG